MALILDITLDSGLTVNSSYAVICFVGGSKTNAKIEVQFYVSKALRDDGKGPVQHNYYQFAPSVAEDSPNHIKQGYEYLKTLPEYELAEDDL